MFPLIRLALPLFSILALTACSSADPAERTSPTTPPGAAPTATGAPHTDDGASTTLRFSSDTTSVDVQIDGDNPTARALIDQVPFTMTLREFNGREKIGDPPAKLPTDGSPGSDPEDGDLIYYVPWGNLGFYYNTEGVGFFDDTIHLGTYHATAHQLSQLEGHVRVTIAR